MLQDKLIRLGVTTLTLGSLVATGASQVLAQETADVETNTESSIGESAPAENAEESTPAEETEKPAENELEKPAENESEKPAENTEETEDDTKEESTEKEDGAEENDDADEAEGTFLSTGIYIVGEDVEPGLVNIRTKGSNLTLIIRFVDENKENIQDYLVYPETLTDIELAKGDYISVKADNDADENGVVFEYKDSKVTEDDAEKESEKSDEEVSDEKESDKEESDKEESEESKEDDSDDDVAKDDSVIPYRYEGFEYDKIQKHFVRESDSKIFVEKDGNLVEVTEEENGEVVKDLKKLPAYHIVEEVKKNFNREYLDEAIVKTAKGISAEEFKSFSDEEVINAIAQLMAEGDPSVGTQELTDHLRKVYPDRFTDAAEPGKEEDKEETSEEDEEKTSKDKEKTSKDEEKTSKDEAEELKGNAPVLTGKKESKEEVAKDGKEEALPETGEASQFAIFGVAALSILGGLGLVGKSVLNKKED